MSRDYSRQTRNLDFAYFMANHRKQGIESVESGECGLNMVSYRIALLTVLDGTPPFVTCFNSMAGRTVAGNASNFKNRVTVCSPRRRKPDDRASAQSIFIVKCQLLQEQQLWQQSLPSQTCHLPLLAVIFQFGIFRGRNVVLLRL